MSNKSVVNIVQCLAFQLAQILWRHFAIFLKWFKNHTEVSHASPHRLPQFTVVNYSHWLLVEQWCYNAHIWCSHWSLLQSQTPTLWQECLWPTKEYGEHCKSFLDENKCEREKKKTWQYAAPGLATTKTPAGATQKIIQTGFQCSGIQLCSLTGHRSSFSSCQYRHISRWPIGHSSSWSPCQYYSWPRDHSSTFLHLQRLMKNHSFSSSCGEKLGNGRKSRTHWLTGQDGDWRRPENDVWKKSFPKKGPCRKQHKSVFAELTSQKANQNSSIYWLPLDPGSGHRGSSSRSRETFFL